MKIKNWIIAILVIVIIILSWKVNQQKTFINNIDNNIDIEYFNAAEAVVDEVCGYIENKYGEYLPDTLWEGDIYNNYMNIRMKYVQ